jgi:endonuclease-3
MKPPAFRETLAILRRRYAAANWAVGRHPFEVLVAIVLSQNSTDAVTGRVMEALRGAIDVTPEGLLAMPPDRLRAVLRPAGLAAQKVPRLRAAAKAIVARYGGDLKAVARLSTEEARAALLALPGVGPKTADVWLSVVAGRDTMPVDTHIARLARRWRLAPSPRYDDVTAALKALIPSEERRRAHLVLIRFGREVCQARRPLCETCPVYDLCDAEERRPRTPGHGT